MSYENYKNWKTKAISGIPHLSIVIPAYNEQERIVATIGAIASHVSDLGFEWELLIADDGSKDDTVKLVEELGLVNLRLLKTPKNGGKGNAVQRGMIASKGRYVLFADADNSTPIEEISKLLAKLEKENYDVAVGSRAVEGAEESNKSFLRHLLSGGLRWIVKNILRINVRDTQCGFKMYTQKAAKELHAMQTIMGFSFDLEILFLASKYGLRIAEVPVSWVDAPGSKVDTKKEIQRFLRDLVNIQVNNFKGVYRRM